jgi:hypothetical protein
VRNSANSLDELLKEIMNNSLQTAEFLAEFNVQDLFQKMFEKIRANHPAIKILIVSWITFLDSIPEIKQISVLHELLPGLFNMLCDKTKDVNQSADKCLKHFLKEIDNQFDSIPEEVIKNVLEIIIEQCKNPQEQARVTAFEWVFMFLQKYLIILSSIYNRNFKIHSSYYVKLKNAKDIPFLKQGAPKEPKNSLEDPGFVNLKGSTNSEFSFKLPSSSKSNLDKEPDMNISNSSFNQNSNKSVSTSEKKENPEVKRVHFFLFPKILEVILINVNSQNEQILSMALSCNTVLIKMIDFFAESDHLNIKSFEEIMKNYMDSKKESTLDLILTWISKLFKRFHEDMFSKIDEFIEKFTNILSEANENVFYI